MDFPFFSSILEPLKGNPTEKSLKLLFPKAFWVWLLLLNKEEVFVWFALLLKKELLFWKREVVLLDLKIFVFELLLEKREPPWFCWLLFPKSPPPPKVLLLLLLLNNPPDWLLLNKLVVLLLPKREVFLWGVVGAAPILKILLVLEFPNSDIFI